MNEESIEYYNEDEIPVQSRKDVYAFTDADFAYLSGKGHKPQHPFKDIKFIVGHFNKSENILHSFEVNGVYTGNDCSGIISESIYFCGAVIIEQEQNDKNKK